jgi:hypothetical protein
VSKAKEVLKADMRCPGTSSTFIMKMQSWTGEQLTDLDAAWNEATVTAGEILKGLDGKLRPGVDWRLEVTDEFANLLFVINVNAKLSHPESLSR